MGGTCSFVRYNKKSNRVKKYGLQRLCCSYEYYKLFVLVCKVSVYVGHSPYGITPIWSSITNQFSGPLLLCPQHIYIGISQVRIARIVSEISLSKSHPNISAPCLITSRLQPAAKCLSLNFFLTDFNSMS